MAPFDRLTAFQKSYELGLAVLKSTEKWPKQHQFGIAAQARRASTSVSINIAEGSCKRGRAEFRRYLDISWGHWQRPRFFFGLLATCIWTQKMNRGRPNSKR
jgi:hypothetical protein